MATRAKDEAVDFRPVRIAVLTITDSRDPEGDESGDRLAQRIADAGHILERRALVRDDIDTIVGRLHHWAKDTKIEVIITSGGTGLTGRDITPEALRGLDGKEIDGFGELFRWLSYQKIGTSTMLSRACAVVAHSTCIFALPGSPSAVTDAWDGILVHQLDSRTRPCNLVALFDRFDE